MRNSNGYGSVIKLTGNRRRPWACRKTVGYTDKGYPKYKYISYHTTKREAVKALREYNADPYNLNQKTFAEVYTLWIEHQDYSRKVQNLYDNAFKRCEPLHKLYMSELSLPKIQGLFDTVTGTKANLNAVKLLLNALINYSVKRGLLPMSASGIMKYVEVVATKDTAKVKRTVFTPQEIEDLWNNKEDGICRLALFYIYTGLRYSELNNAIWHDNYLEIKKAKTKAGVRTVPLSDKALSLCPITPMKYTTYESGLKKYNHNPHDTRHTFISLMTEAQIDKRILKKIVGHSTEDVTENVYTHISLETMLEAVNRI